VVVPLPVSLFFERALPTQVILDQRSVKRCSIQADYLPKQMTNKIIKIKWTEGYLVPIKNIEVTEVSIFVSVSETSEHDDS